MRIDGELGDRHAVVGPDFLELDQVEAAIARVFRESLAE